MRKTFLLLCLLIISLVSLAFTFSLVTTRRTLQQNTNQYLHMTHRQVRENIERFVMDVENIAFSMCYSPSVQKYLREVEPAKRVPLFADVQAVFSSISYMNHAIMGYSIYDGQGRFLTANGSAFQVITLRDTIDIQTEPRYSTAYPPNPYIGNTLPGYILTLPVLETQTGIPSSNVIGAVVFTVSLSFIENQISAGNLYSGSSMVLLDEGRRTIASSGAAGAAQPDRSAVLLSETGVEGTGWALATSHQPGVLSDDMQALWRVTLLTGFSIIGLILAFFGLISRRILRPIEGMSHFMQEVSRHPGPRQYLPTQGQYEEITSMADSMNLMLKALDQKTEDLLAQEKKTSAAEMAADRLEILAYRSQINPHFLYNTLDCISGMAFRYDAPEIADISQALSGMFRYAVKGQDFVTVAEEVLHMREYATIIHHRFMGRIHIHFHVTEKAAHERIPRLVLQPVLENAVFHGVEKKLGEGKIEVDIEASDGVLRLCVRDNGLGMTAQQAAELRSWLSHVGAHPSENELTAGHEKGVGLWNIAHRLHLFYQGSSVLAFESQPGKGTQVQITLPAQREGDANVSSHHRR